MRWIVDLDAHAPTRGAIRFATSLARAGGPDGAERVHPVRVLDQDHLRSVLRLHHLDEVVEAERDAGREMLGDAAGSFQDVQVVQARYEEEGLASTREALDADGVIVGRDDRRVVKLGRVARRLLRNVPCPIIVVPAELGEGAQLDGPVIALTDLREHSAEAYRFAARLARESRRELIALFVIDDQPRERHQVELTAWTSACGLPADRHMVVRGDVVAAALTVANDHRAMILVTGFRPRSELAALLGRSVGRALAARTAVPIAIVPSATVRRESAVEPAGAREPLRV
jgi:nucleotide-binding universal stress UspA family protein